MTAVRVESIAEPLASRPSDAVAAATLLARSEVMGFLPDGADTSVLDVTLLVRLIDRLRDRGVVRSPGLSLVTTENLHTVLAGAVDATEHSPMPDGEWEPLLRILGEDLLTNLLGVSASSVHRYATGARPTPQPVAARLHVLALLVADLAGAYNDFGIRRWFVRARTQLDGRSPGELLSGPWDPEGPDVAQLRELAGALVASPAT